MLRLTIAEHERQRITLEELDSIGDALAKGGLWNGSPKPRRDAKGRWAKGASGNPNGRPRKAERALSTHHEIKSFIEATEAPRKVKTAEGIIEVPAIELIYRSMIAKAAEGHGPSQRYVMRKREEALLRLERNDHQLQIRMQRIEDILLQMKREGFGAPRPELAKLVSKARRKSRVI